MPALLPSRVLARNVGYNLLGHMAPLLVAVVAIPLLIQGLGAARFGILALAWTVIGYFSLFDLGVGRALTQVLSAEIAAGREAESGQITWTALWLMLGLGAAGGVALALFATWLAVGALGIAPELQRETIDAFRVLAAALPLIVMTAGLRGVFEAHQHFGIATALRLPYSIFTFLGPLAVVQFSTDLVALVAVLVAGRVVLWAAHLVAVLRRYPSLRHGLRPHRRHVRDLLRTGGWMTVSNVVSPLMVNLDRFLIAGMIGASAVAYYVTPYEVATKLLLIPGALLGVLFPAFAASYVHDPAATARRAVQAVRVLLVALFPLVLLLSAFAPEGLTLWVGEEFALRGVPVLQWLAAGVLINAVGHVPFGVLQGIGRSDITARLHLVELPLYLAGLWFLARHFGVTGVAIAWTLRVSLDTAILLKFSATALPHRQIDGGIVATLGCMLGTIAIVSFTPGLVQRAALTAIALGAFGLFAWRGLLQPPERALVLSILSARRPTTTG